MSLINQLFAGKPTQADFVQRVVQALAKAGIEKAEEIEGEFALKIGDDKSTIYLSNIYSNYCSAPRNKRFAVLAEFVTGAAAIPSLPLIPSEFAEAKSMPDADDSRRWLLQAYAAHGP